MKTKKFLPLVILPLGLGLALYIFIAQSATPTGANWVVDRLDDPTLPDGSACTDAPNDCSLRGAISVYNSGDMITFEITGTATITNGEMLITNGDLTILGPGTEDLIISAGNASRIFFISPGQQVNISGVTLRDGFASQGGAIFNDRSALILENCLLTNNTAEDHGGAIYNAANNVVPQAGPAPAASVLINNCIVSNNAASGIDDDDQLGGGDPTGIGGAIYNSALETGATAAVTITHSILSGNSADDDFYAGGAITNFARNAHATVHIADSTLSANTALYGDGGAIANYALDEGATAAITVLNSTMSNNSTGSDFGGGGAIFSFAYNRDTTGLTAATLYLEKSTFDGNMASADRGGAVFNGALDSSSTAIAHILNSTFSGNQAADVGGAIANDAYNRDAFGETNATIHITHATFMGNEAGSGGAISNVAVNGEGVVVLLHLKNSLIHHSTGGDCLNNGMVDGANNLIDDTTCGSDSPFRLGTPTLVDLTLQDNGGTTFTHALLEGSNAEDAVPDGECTVVNTTTPVTEDQRSEPRPLGAVCDVGAVEGTIPSEPPAAFIYLPLVHK